MDDISTSTRVFGYLASSAALKMAFSYLTSRNRPPHAEKVGVVSSVLLYPVKSMKGISLKQAKCTHAGLYSDGFLDRSFVVTHGSNYRFISGRQEPTIMLISVSVNGGSLHLDAPGMQTLIVNTDRTPEDATIAETRIWNENIEGVDCGDEAAQWLCKYLGKEGFRLLHHANDLGFRTINERSSKYEKNAKDADKVTYHDVMSYHLLSQSSVDDLNRRLEAPVDVRNFRPNLFIKTDSDVPYDEDNWVEIFIGSSKFTAVVQCDRCRQTTVMPDAGVKNSNDQPFTELQKYRIFPEINNDLKSPYFGTFLIADWPGEIHEGDPVYVIRGSLQ